MRPTPKVVVVAPTDDPHGDAVEAALRLRGATVARAAVDQAGDPGFVVDPGRCVSVAGCTVADGWSVWWHRIGTLPQVPGAGPDEQALAHDEARALFVGGLLALDVRWVDEPAVVERAEHTVLQLAVAQACGASVPQTLATADPTRGMPLLGGGPAVAKAVSSGPGLAPFTGAVTEPMLSAVAGAPTLLQRRVHAIADLRLVVVGRTVLAWRREQVLGGPIDWRAADPSGQGFRPVPVDRSVGAVAAAICERLGLTTSVQDWLVDATGRDWFLEVNPVGRWLFLAGADHLVPALLAKHLMAPQSSVGPSS